MGNSPPPSASLVFKAEGSTPGVRTVGNQLILEGVLPWLDGPSQETLATGERLESLPRGALLHAKQGLAGVLLSQRELSLTEATRELYTRLLEMTQGLALARVWNFVPRINEEIAGLENYRAFNAGRHQAFQAAWGADLTGQLPAASALGMAQGPVCLAFVASRNPVRYFENPLQIPALNYPPQYGIKPPAFCRGSVVAAATNTWHLSGTASIRGAETCGRHFASQMQLTLENIATICSHMDIPATRAAHWKIFLRHPHDLKTARAAMHRAYPQDAPSMIFLQADICRADLLVEVEGIFQQTHPT